MGEEKYGGEIKIKAITDEIQDLIPSPIWNIYTKEYKPLPDFHIRVTELISSPLRRKLLRQYYENISPKISKIHYQILGTMIHTLFELKEFKEILDEMKLAYELNDNEKFLDMAKRLIYRKSKKRLQLEFDDFIILGEIDLFEDNILYDFKVTSEFVVKNQKFDKYEKQLQIYRYMYEEQTGEKINTIKNVFFIRDFSLLRSKLESPIVIVEYPLADKKEIELYIKERLKLHKEGTLCSDEDMMFVIKYKVGNMYYSDEEKAEEASRKRKLPIQKEITPLGCLYFCEVSDFCPQWKALKEIHSNTF